MQVQFTLEQSRGLGAPTFHAVENPCIIYRWSSVSKVDSTNQGSCSAVVFAVEKNLRVSEPMLF